MKIMLLTPEMGIVGESEILDFKSPSWQNIALNQNTGFILHERAGLPGYEFNVELKCMECLKIYFYHSYYKADKMVKRLLSKGKAYCRKY